MTRKQPRERRRAQIIDAAVKELLKKGYENTSMESIAKRAKLTKGGVYHHFSGKDELLLAANDRFFEPLATLMARLAELDSGEEALRRYIRAYLDYWESHKDELVFTFLSLTKMLAAPPLWPALSAYFDATTSFLKDRLDAAVARGELDIPNTTAQATALASALDGVGAYLVAHPQMSAAQVAEDYCQVFLPKASSQPPMSTAR